ncbi:MAG TPA: YdcF family protein [Bacteroidia bacterium]
MKKRTRAYILLILICAAGFFSAHLHFCYNTFYRPAQLFSAALDNKPLDAVIVPGIPCDAGRWGFVMKWRVLWSVFLYKSGVAKNIIYSGSAVYTPYTEAVIMSLYAEKMGVPKKNIFLETRAQHTTENLYYSWELAKSLGFKKIAFATDPFQSLLIEPYIKEFGLDVSLVPSVISIMEYLPPFDAAIESYKAYKLGFVSIRDRETKEEQSRNSKGERVRKKMAKKFQNRH